MQGVSQVQGVNDSSLAKEVDESLMATLKDSIKESTENDQSGQETKLQYFLAALGLPTISHHMTQHIWDLEFVKIKDFLSSNKTMQLLENLKAPKGLAGGAAV